MIDFQRELWLDGQWTPGSGNDAIDVVDPATGQPFATVASASPEDVDIACDAADTAQRLWSEQSPRSRSETLRQCWATILDHEAELADTIVREQGKPYADAIGEVRYAAEFFRWNAEEAVRIPGSLTVAPSGANRILVQHPPIGVVVIVTPWNFPAAMITRKLAPALAAGNAAVIKPPSETPLTALRIAELIHEAGIPSGLVNVLPTNQPSEWFDRAVDHRATRMVSFTGSTATGRLLLRRSADRVLKVAMELGGNAPFIVFDDADIDAAVEGAMVAKMRHSAQTCTAANRFFVHETVAADFTDKLTQAMRSVTIGSGFEPGVDCGPLINDIAIERIEQLIATATDAGANVQVGGSRVHRAGFFFKPTVLSGLAPDSTVGQDEIFGPVAPVLTFTDTDDLVKRANDTEMGLAAYVYTRDIGRGLAISSRLESGMVGINRGAMSDPAAPFGGMKQSGLGREGAYQMRQLM